MFIINNVNSLNINVVHVYSQKAYFRSYILPVNKRLIVKEKIHPDFIAEKLLTWC